VDNKQTGGVPFLFQFSEFIETQVNLPFRYDEFRQLGQVLIDSNWVDAVDAPGPEVAAAGTLMTQVQRETTDNR
jgi:hypothetical protein